MNLYLAGIGGSGLAALAQLAQDCGYHVEGSELDANSNVKMLNERGISVHIGQSGEEIALAHKQKPIDWLVVSSALPADHPEIAFAQAHNIKLSKRDELINLIIKEKDLKLIAVSGTHGKTTTTAMIIWLFKQLSLPASYAVGTNLSFGPSASFQKGSEFFIYEADEFDRNFLAFHPYISVLPAVEYDHSDTYPSPAEYHQAFKEFINQSHCTFTWKSVASELGISKEPKLHLEADNQPKQLEQISLLGNHNKHNGWLALKVVKELTDKDDQLLITALNSFPGSERRMEKLAQNLYSDYAHHPTEIAASLQMAAELGNDVVAVYQPHQNIRQHEIRNKYKECFDLAKKIYWLPTYLSREDPKLAILTPEELVSESDPDTQAKTELAEMNNALAVKIKQHQAFGDLVVLMGAGSIDAWAKENLI